VLYNSPSTPSLAPQLTLLSTLDATRYLDDIQRKMLVCAICSYDRKQGVEKMNGYRGLLSAENGRAASVICR
jgi:hypothetical protein